MPTVPNKLMPWLQATAAMIILILFCTLAVGPMLGLKPADVDIKEVEKAIVLILVGFLFGSSANSAKKDDQNAALTAQLLPSTPPTGVMPTGTTSDPVAVHEVSTPPTA